MGELITSLWRREDGQALAEYGLILALIAVVAIAGLAFLGGAVRDKLEHVGNTVNNAP